MISRASGCAQRSRLAGASTWAMTCSLSRRERRGGRRVTQLLVVVFEAVDALGGGVQGLQQRGVAGALPLGWDGLCGGGAMAAATALDIEAQVGLGVEPGPGDVGFAGEALESDGRAGGVEAAQRGHGAAPGLLGAALRGGAQVAGVVSRHRGRPSGRVRSRRAALLNLGSGFTQTI